MCLSSLWPRNQTCRRRQLHASSLDDRLWLRSLRQGNLRVCLLTLSESCDAMLHVYGQIQTCQGCTKDY